ncbi:MAG: nitroreductase family protein [Candidatus Muiribacteriota bacterium]
MNCILKRRSIRKYKDQTIEDKKIEQLVRAGLAAPSARGTEPWQLFVIRNRKILDKISEVHPYAKMVKEAPLAIVVAFDLENDKAKDWFQQDLSAATENILCMAAELGLGSVWLGVYPREDRVKGISDLLGCEGEFLPFSLISIGYPAEEKEPKTEMDNSKVAYID